MGIRTTKQYAGQLLDKLRHLDAETSSAFFEMGRLLSSISHGKLWDILGYTGLANMVEEELSFTQSTAAKYLHTYRHFQRLHYTKTEALELIGEFSFTRISQWIPGASQKVGKRAIQNAINKLIEENRQINFFLTGVDRDALIKALEQYGAEQNDGRLMHSSEALMKMVRDRAKPNLRVVKAA